MAQRGIGSSMGWHVCARWGKKREAKHDLEGKKNAQDPKKRSLFRDYQRDCLHQVMEQLKAGKAGSESEEQNEFLTSGGERRWPRCGAVAVPGRAGSRAGSLPS